MSQLPPPKGYVSWLQFAVDTMDARGAFVDDWFTDREIPTQDEIRAAAQAELDQLQAFSPDDGPLSEKQVAALREAAAQHLPRGRTTGTEALFDGDLDSRGGFFNKIDKEFESELEDLADAAKGAADRASLSIDDALRVIEESNLRIANLEKGTRTGIAKGAF